MEMRTRLGMALLLAAQASRPRDDEGKTEGAGEVAGSVSSGAWRRPHSRTDRPSQGPRTPELPSAPTPRSFHLLTGDDTAVIL